MGSAVVRPATIFAMLTLIRELIAHKRYANELMLDAIRQHENASRDPDILELLHHIYIANRFWFVTCAGDASASALSEPGSQSCDALHAAYDLLQDEEEAWLATVPESEVARILEHPQIPGGRCSVAHALLQVCLHTQGHRAQCAKMLRRLGGIPPMTDFILWSGTRLMSVQRFEEQPVDCASAPEE